MNKKGVSDVIATILIILLVLAAIIIVWQVVSKVVKGGASTVEQKAKCLDISLEFVGGSVKCDNDTATVGGSIARGADNVGNIKMKIIVGTNVSDASTSEIPIALATAAFSESCPSADVCENNDKITVKIAPVIISNEDIICDPADEITVTCTP